jgi:small multidrug resistance pump
MDWLLLAGAILAEVTATLSLRAATAGRPVFYVPVVLGYLAAFALLFAGLRAGLPLGVAYGTWAAVGVALTALASRFLFSEQLTGRMIGGIVLIAGGVLLLELGAQH